MAKLYNQKVRDVCGALRHEGVGPGEIVRRLNANEAGLGFKVPIKVRRVHEYIEAYNQDHGPPPKPEDEDQTLDSIARMKHRARALLAREIAALEKKRKGTITAAQSSALRSHYRTLEFMEAREHVAAKRSAGRSPRKATSNGNGNGKSERAESELERLAREQAEES